MKNGVTVSVLEFLIQDLCLAEARPSQRSRRQEKNPSQRPTRMSYWPQCDIMKQEICYLNILLAVLAQFGKRCRVLLAVKLKV